ncbi:hypothetical protein PIROE2DRAFT_21260 [Piromyces sp. E2]|nr:hypothetical protein PIROE2DRAFT_21260 [Piromyces sp. E2]|eukprot:OUM59326.1 hypothetical protein PIROE2DRAFT_21260 [Piromyces sp. E2]
MIILSGFVIFVAFTGYSGAYTNWKPIILTFSVLASMAFLGHMYVAKKLLDATRFTQRDMAISWWDVYTDPIRKEIQDRFSCCGYLYYGDLPVASNFCLDTDVEVVTRYDISVKNPADVQRNDSYRNHFGTANSVSDDSYPGGGATQDQAQAPANQAPANQAPANQAPANQAPANPVQPPNDGGDNGVDNGVDDGGDDGMDDGGDNGGWMKKRAEEDHSYLRKRQAQNQNQQQEVKVEDLKISQAPGCKDFLVPMIKSKLKFSYILNYALCIIYLVAIGLSLYYWQNMRKEKEFDEFA